MRKEDFFEVLGELDDDIVKGAKAPVKRKANWKAWGAMAACLCLAVIGALVIQNPIREPDMETISPPPDHDPEINTVSSEGDPKESVPVKTNFLVVNELESLSMADMDVKYVFYEKLPYHVWCAILEDFREYTGVSYEDFTARIPDAWEYVNFYSLAIRGYKDADLSDEYRLHDYVFDFRTAGGGEARIALCSAEQPLRDCIIVCDNPKQSEINGVPVVIHGINDLFIAGFIYEDVHYDIETRGIGLEELEELLSGVLSASESASEKEE